MGRFDHIKNQPRPKITIEQFINDANSHFPISQLKDKERVLLMLDGKMKREVCVKPITLYIKKDIKDDLDLYCAGNRQAVINYLLRQAINNIKENKELIFDTI